MWNHSVRCHIRCHIIFIFASSGSAFSPLVELGERKVRRGWAEQAVLRGGLAHGAGRIGYSAAVLRVCNQTGGRGCYDRRAVTSQLEID
jgi:hypothetical protein